MGLDAAARSTDWSAWYSAKERKRLAMRYTPRNVVEFQLQQRCRSSGSVAHCDAFLTTRLDAWARAPMPFEARSSLLWLALEHGGAGAYDRLRAHATDTPAVALEAASGTEVGALLEEWLAWVRTQRPDVAGQASHSRWLALTWILLFAGLATRSTRWRLG